MGSRGAKCAGQNPKRRRPAKPKRSRAEWLAAQAEFRRKKLAKKLAKTKGKRKRVKLSGAIAALGG